MVSKDFLDALDWAYNLPEVDLKKIDIILEYVLKMPKQDLDKIIGYHLSLIK
jgi:hypothetical protein